MISIEDAEQFNNVLKNDSVVAVFGAPWCGPCKMLEPVFEEIEKRHSAVTFIKIDVEKCPDLAYRYHIKSVPVALFFIKGEMINEMIGVQEGIEEFIKSNMII